MGLGFRRGSLRPTEWVLTPGGNEKKASGGGRRENKAKFCSVRRRRKFFLPFLPFFEQNLKLLTAFGGRGWVGGLVVQQYKGHSPEGGVVFLLSGGGESLPLPSPYTHIWM